MSDEEKEWEKCPDCVGMPEKPRPIFFTVSILAVSFLLLYFFIPVMFHGELNDEEIGPLLYIVAFLLILLFFFGAVVALFETFYSIIGTYTWSYFDSEHPYYVHTHKSIIESNGKYFHLKKTRTDNSYAEQRVEITGPIFRLKCGGWFKRSEILNLVLNYYRIRENNKHSVLLECFSSSHCQMRQGLKISLGLVRDFCSIHDVVFKRAQNR